MHKGQRLTQEVLDRMRLNRMGKSYPRKSHPHSQETKEKIRRIRTGSTASVETKDKMSAVRKGVLKTPVTKQAMSIAAKDKTRPGYLRRSEATSASNVRRHLSGIDLWVKGYHRSPKAGPGPIAYRSVLIELPLMIALDADPEVCSWESPFTISYLDSRGAKKHTLPDFMVVTRWGRRYIIEGKGNHLLKDYLSGEKFVAVKRWCEDNLVGFYLVVAQKKDMGFWWVEVVPCP